MALNQSSESTALVLVQRFLIALTNALNIFANRSSITTHVRLLSPLRLSPAH